MHCGGEPRIVAWTRPLHLKINPTAAAAFALLAGLSILSTVLSPALAQSAPALTVDAIYGHGSLTGDQPGGFAWAPNAKLVLYSAHDDVMAVDASSKPWVFVDHNRLAALTSTPGAEQDRDHRARYGQSNYIWAPDSEHLLIDTDGSLVIYSPHTHTGLQVASTGSGSGDDPKFSPNGVFVSYIRDHNLFLRRVLDNNAEVELSKPREDSHEPESSRLVLNGQVDWVYEEDLDVRSNYFWSPDSKRIAYLQMDESNVPEYPIEDWIPVHATVDKQRYPQPGDLNPAVRVGVVGAEGGKTVWIKLPAFNQAGGGNRNDAINEYIEYIPRFGWLNPETLWIETLSRDQQHLNLYFADIKSGSSRLVLARTDDKFLDESYDIDFTASDFFLRSWQDGHTHIYRYGFDAHKPLSSDAHLVRQLTSGPYEVRGIANIDESAQTVYYVSNEDDPLGQQVWSVRWDGSAKHRLSGGTGFHDASFAPHGETWLDTASDAATPPRVSFCHKQDCKPIWTSTPLPFPLQPLQRLELKDAAGSGVLYGTLLLPSSAIAPASVPLIVNPYGGPGAQGVQDKWGGSGRLFDELLAQRGYAVLHVDNRGMAGRGRDFEQAAYRNFGPVQFADQLAAIDQALALYPALDCKRLGWWGWSWGGTFTLYAMTHSDRFRAGAAGAPVTDWRDYDSIYTERYLGLPAADPDLYRDDSVNTVAANLKGRLLLMHGTGDDNVHLENSVQFIQQLINAGIPYDFQIYPRKTHSAHGPETQTHLHARLLEHFDTYLKPPNPVASP
jgi:dipeptidyl-peptidase-4